MIEILLLVFTEGENIDELCQKLQTIEVWLESGVHTLQWGKVCTDIETNNRATEWEFLLQCCFRSCE